MRILLVFINTEWSKLSRFRVELCLIYIWNMNICNFLIHFAALNYVPNITAYRYRKLNAFT